jgi:hypothetical protein
MGIRELLRRVRALTNEIQAVFYGLDGSGKSAIVRCMSGDPLITPPPTESFEVWRTSTRGHQLTLWDIGGSKPNRPRWASFLDQADLLVWVADTADQARLAELQNEFDRFISLVADKFSALLILTNPIGQPICPPDRLGTLLDFDRWPNLAITVLPCNPRDPSSVQRVLVAMCQIAAKQG